MTKQEQAFKHFQNQDYKKAFALLRNFKLDVTKNDKRLFSIAFDSFDKSRRSFWTQVGVDVDSSFQQAVELASSKFQSWYK